ncbi:MAG: hypothetical protein WD941_03740 [Opitutus sp.]
MSDVLSPPPDPARLKARQKATLTVLAVSLVAAGLLVLFVLDRIPGPMRLLMGVGDLFAGLVLLVLVRQKFGQPGH